MSNLILYLTHKRTLYLEKNHELLLFQEADTLHNLIFDFRNALCAKKRACRLHQHNYRSVHFKLRRKIGARTWQNFPGRGNAFRACTVKPRHNYGRRQRPWIFLASFDNRRFQLHPYVGHRLVWRLRSLLLREIRLSNIFNSFSTLFLTSVPLSITFIIAERGKQQPQVVYSPIYYHNFKLLSSIFYNFFSFYKTT